jgi:AraC family transcriptional regulator
LKFCKKIKKGLTKNIKSLKIKKGVIKMETVRIYEIPDCKMVSSGIGMFGEEKFDNFFKWFTSLPRQIFPRDFLFFEGEGSSFKGMHWLYIYEDGMEVPDDYEIIGFKGGLYAVLTDIDQKTDMDALNVQRDDFLKVHGFEIDKARPGLGNIITPPSAEKVLGYNQMDYYTPIKIK